MNARLSDHVLRICSNRSTLEVAPVLLAAQRLGPQRVDLSQGGIPSLWGEVSDLPSLAALGTSHVATNSETQGLRFSAKHPDLRLVCSVAQGLYRIVARRSAGIRSFSDLRGKRIGTMPRTSAAYYLHRALGAAGVNDSEVQVVPFVAGTDLPLEGMTPALLQGELDAIAIWEPEMQRAQDALGDDAIEFCEPGIYRERCCLFSTASQLANADMRAHIVAFVRELHTAATLVQADPRQAQELMAQAAQLDLATVKRSWPHHVYSVPLADDLLDLLVEEEIWVATEAGRVPRGREELAPLIDRSVLQEALAG